MIDSSTYRAAIVTFLITLSIVDCVQSASQSIQGTSLTSSSTPSSDVTFFKLPQGLPVIISRIPQSRTVSLSAITNLGQQDESLPNLCGTRYLMAHAMRKGTRYLAGAQITEAVADMGGTLNIRVEADFIAFNITVLKGHESNAISLIAELLAWPSLTNESIDSARAVSLSAQTRLRTNPLNFGYETARALIYGNRPYGLSMAGYPNSIQQIPGALLRRFHQVYVRSGNMVLAMAGDVDIRLMTKHLESAFRNLPAGAKPVKRLPVSVKFGASRTAVKQMATRRAHLIAAFPTTGYGHPDLMPLYVLATLAGRGIGSQLYQAFREKTNFSYKADATYIPHRHAGELMLHLDLDPSQLEKAQRHLEATIKQVANGNFDDKAVARARAYLITTHQLACNPEYVAFQMATHEILGDGFQSHINFPALIAAVDASDVRRVAKKYMQRAVLVVILPE